MHQRYAKSNEMDESNVDNIGIEINTRARRVTCLRNDVLGAFVLIMRVLVLVVSTWTWTPGGLSVGRVERLSLHPPAPQSTTGPCGSASVGDYRS